jgi:hypothetical protein
MHYAQHQALKDMLLNDLLCNGTGTLLEESSFVCSKLAVAIGEVAKREW